MKIFYNEKQIGEIKDGQIYSKDIRLNFLLAYTKKHGYLIGKSREESHILVYSKKPEDFWEFLLNSGFSLVE